MTTQMEAAQGGVLTAALIQAAEREGMEPAVLRRSVAEGTVVILANNRRPHTVATAVGAGCQVKVNANFGTSPRRTHLREELHKLDLARRAGADTVMDLSTGGDLDEVRRAIIKASDLPVGTVPIYQAVVQTTGRGGDIPAMDPEEIFSVIEGQAEDGVDFITVHCGVTTRSLERLQRQGRVTDIVSRGGAFLAEWMLANQQENPLYKQFDRLLALARRYDLTLSLGDGLRPGSIADATDRAQVEELITLGELAAEAHRAGVQVMIEGPGHVPLDQVETNIVLEKELCNQAPFYVLGPIVTDVAPGYDHITSAIGGALAAYHGADFLCAVSPSEHLGLPTPAEVFEGVVAAKIAAHAADIARGDPRARQRDRKMSTYRKALDWQGQMQWALDPDKITAVHQERDLGGDVCSMCGEYCAMKVVRERLRSERA